MTASINRLSESEVAQLEQLYRLENKRDIIKFLNKNGFLLPVLLVAPTKIREYFHPQELVLELTSDPEYPKEQVLFLDIFTDLDTDPTYDRLKQLNNAWFFDYPTEILMKLTISAESSDDNDEL